MELSEIFRNPRAEQHTQVGEQVQGVKSKIFDVLNGLGYRGPGASRLAPAPPTGMAEMVSHGAPVAAEPTVGAAQALQVVAGLEDPKVRHLTLVGANNAVDEALVSFNGVDQQLLERLAGSGAAEEVITTATTQAFVRTHLGAEVAAGRVAAEEAAHLAPQVESAFIKGMQALAR